MAALRAAGAHVLVHEAGTSATTRSASPARAIPPLQSQLALAVHADVIMGQHGAGLTHALFAAKGAIVLEFKTVYGFELDLFRLVAGTS